MRVFTWTTPLMRISAPAPIVAPGKTETPVARNARRRRRSRAHAGRRSRARRCAGHGRPGRGRARAPSRSSATPPRRARRPRRAPPRRARAPPLPPSRRRRRRRSARRRPIPRSRDGSPRARSAWAETRRRPHRPLPWVQRSPPTARAEALGPQDSRESWGLFVWSERRSMAAEETRHYLTNGSADKPAPRETLEWAGQTQAQMVDLKFCDLLGTWQHVTLPLSAFDESAFDEGLGFDGSSIRGWQGISESDMLLMPDASSAVLDPFTAAPTLSLVCEIVDPVTRQPYPKDPRRIAKRAEEYLRETDVADTAFIGPECEFFVLDTVSYELADHKAHYEIDSEEGHWNSGAPGLGYTVRPKEGYFPPAPHDTLADLRSAMVLALERRGIPCEALHHEVASSGQCEIDLRYQPLTRMADEVMTYKYVVKNVARAAGKTVTFMPKPLFGDNGSGMHTHQSLWKEGTPLMADKSGYAGLSQIARTYIGGLLMHAPALLAFCAPTTNSYRRLVPGFEAPVNLVYSQRNRSACIRIPMYSESPKAKRIEFRCPDSSANPYLAFAAMLMAGIDGIERGLDPGAPAEDDIFEDDSGVPQVPGSLAEALDALEADHDFLTRDGVFSKDHIAPWIAYKRELEVDAVRLRPPPAEFALYFDA